ncbi:MAG: hypothetical protein Q9218_006448 [Villophora microphyllina]
MSDAPKPGDFGLDPTWALPGKLIKQFKDERLLVINRVHLYNEHVLDFHYTKLNERLDSLLAQNEGTKTTSEHRTDLDLEDNDTDSIDKIQEDLVRAQGNPYQASQQRDIFSSELEAGTMENTNTDNTQTDNLSHTTILTTTPKASDAPATTLATVGHDWIQSFSNWDEAAYKPKKENLPKKASPEKKSSKKNISSKKSSPQKLLQVVSSGHTRSATAGPSAPPRSMLLQEYLHTHPQSAPRDDGTLTPFKRRFQSSTQVKQTSSAANLEESDQAVTDTQKVIIATTDDVGDNAQAAPSTRGHVVESPISSLDLDQLPVAQPAQQPSYGTQPESTQHTQEASLISTAIMDDLTGLIFETPTLHPEHYGVSTPAVQEDNQSTPEPENLISTIESQTEAAVLASVHNPESPTSMLEPTAEVKELSLTHGAESLISLTETLTEGGELALIFEPESLISLTEPHTELQELASTTQHEPEQLDAALWAGLDVFDAQPSITSSGTATAEPRSSGSGSGAAPDQDVAVALVQLEGHTPHSPRWGYDGTASSVDKPAEENVSSKGSVIVAAAPSTSVWVPPHLRGVNVHLTPRSEGMGPYLISIYSPYGSDLYINRSVVGVCEIKKRGAIKGQSLAGYKAASVGAGIARNTTR